MILTPTESRALRAGAIEVRRKVRHGETAIPDMEFENVATIYRERQLPRMMGLPEWKERGVERYRVGKLYPAVPGRNKCLFGRVRITRIRCERDGDGLVWVLTLKLEQVREGAR